jgi:hypothetical protein
VAEPKLQALPLNLIHLDADTQSRESICYKLLTFLRWMFFATTQATAI